MKSELQDDSELKVCGLKSGGALLDKSTIRFIMEASQRARRVEGATDVFLYREVQYF